ncbi:MAG: hypothetical protein WC119_01805 [Synergistaceae bacterium]
MAQIKIYNQETDSYYQINYLLQQAILDDTADGALDYYLAISTNIPTIQGGTFPTYRVRTLSDTPPGKGTASDFNELCEWYRDYFCDQAELAESSESSSSSSSSSSYGKSSSSSSSSVGESSSSSS